MKQIPSLLSNFKSFMSLNRSEERALVTIDIYKYSPDLEEQCYKTSLEE